MPFDGVLQDDDIRLRPINENTDIEAALEWYRDKEVLYYSEGSESAVFDRNRVLKMYSYLARIGELYIIDVLSEGKWLPIGDVTLSDSTIPIVIGDRRYRSRGFGERVISLIIQRARELGWQELNVRCIYDNNERSLRLFLNAGFERKESYEDSKGRKCIPMRLQLNL